MTQLFLESLDSAPYEFQKEEKYGLMDIIYTFSEGDHEFKLHFEKSIKFGKYVFVAVLGQKTPGFKTFKKVSTRFQDPRRVIATIIMIIRDIRDTRRDVKGIVLELPETALGSYGAMVGKIIQRDLRSVIEIAPQEFTDGDFEKMVLTGLLMTVRPNQYRNIFTGSMFQGIMEPEAEEKPTEEPVVEAKADDNPVNDPAEGGQPVDEPEGAKKSDDDDTATEPKNTDDDELDEAAKSAAQVQMDNIEALAKGLGFHPKVEGKNIKTDTIVSALLSIEFLYYQVNDDMTITVSFAGTKDQMSIVKGIHSIVDKIGKDDAELYIGTGKALIEIENVEQRLGVIKSIISSLKTTKLNEDGLNIDVVVVKDEGDQPAPDTKPDAEGQFVGGAEGGVAPIPPVELKEDTATGEPTNTDVAQGDGGGSLEKPLDDKEGGDVQTRAPQEPVVTPPPEKVPERKNFDPSNYDPDFPDGKKTDPTYNESVVDRLKLGGVVQQMGINRPGFYFAGANFLTESTATGYVISGRGAIAERVGTALAKNLSSLLEQTVEYEGGAIRMKYSV